MAERASELDRAEAELVAELVGGFGKFFEFFAAVGLEEFELLATMGEGGKSNSEEADLALRVTMTTEEIEKDSKDISVELHGFVEGLRPRIGFETGVTNSERKGAGGEAGFPKTLAGFLRKVAEQGFHVFDVQRVFAESVIVGDGLGLSVDEEFVGVATAGLAIESGAPLAKDFFEFFLGVRGELIDGFDPDGAQGALCDLTDAGDFANGKRGKKARFHARRDPDEAAGFGLVGGDFCR